MPINHVIHQKRKELELTQEQIADYLGVSTPAVNKWEKGVSYPDITLLPPLARILNIDLNTLLCFQESLTSQEITNFTTQVVHLIEKEGYENGFDLAFQKIKEYPNCGELIIAMATFLDGSLSLYGYHIEDKKVFEEKILNLYEHAAKSDHQETRNTALYLLITKHIAKKEFDKAQEQLNLLPEKSDLDKKHLQALLLREQDKLPQSATILERKLLTDLTNLQTTLFSLVEVELAMDNQEKVEKLSKGIRVLVKEFDLGSYSAYVVHLEIAIKRKDTTKALLALKSILKELKNPWRFENSILYKNLLASKNRQPQEDSFSQTTFESKLIPSILAQMEQDPSMDFLRSNKEFLQLIKEYQHN